VKQKEEVDQDTRKQEHIYIYRNILPMQHETLVRHFLNTCVCVCVRVCLCVCCNTSGAASKAS